MYISNIRTLRHTIHDMICSYTKRERETENSLHFTLGLRAMELSFLTGETLTVLDEQGQTAEAVKKVLAAEHFRNSGHQLTKKEKVISAMAETTTKPQRGTQRWQDALVSPCRAEGCSTSGTVAGGKSKKQTSLSLPKGGHHRLLQFATVTSTLPASESKMVQPKLKERTPV